MEWQSWPAMLQDFGLRDWAHVLHFFTRERIAWCRISTSTTERHSGRGGCRGRRSGGSGAVVAPSWPSHPGWFGPRMPGLFPMPPGITGGDYDRLPQPFLQGGPGMLGGPLRHDFRGQQGHNNGRGFGGFGGFRMH